MSIVRLLMGQAVAAGLGCSFAKGADYSTLIGAANINPSYYLNSSSDILNEGQNQLAAVGSHTEKLELDQYDLQTTWSDNSKYAWNTTWPAFNSSTSLTSIASNAPFTKSFADSRITNYLLTTYSPNIPGGGDGTEYWLNGMTSAEKSSETTSFYNLTRYLMQTYSGTGKSFYLENWEGDWALRGANRNTPTSTTAVKGMIDWFNARQAGIDAARTQLAAQYPDVHVYGTVEVNRVQDAMGGDAGGFATVTNDVLPYTNTDFASYSSYDTQQNTTGTYSYANAVAYLATHLPTSAANGQNTHSVYVGEFGLAEDSAGSAAVNSMMNNVINTAVSDGMPMALFWEVYSNELSNGVTTPPAGKGTNSAVKGFYLVKPDGTPSTAWHTIRSLIATNDPNQSTSAAIERNLHLSYATSFTAPGATLGSAWTENTTGGAMSVGIANGQLQMTTVNAASVPLGQATLNIDSVIGHGLQVGDYLQFSLSRQNSVGIIGVSAFGLNHGSGIGSGTQPLNVYPGISGYGWTPFSYNGSNNTNTSYNWDSGATTLGLRLTSADGSIATISYYVNGTYSGSWLYKTTSTSLDNFSLFSQSSTANAGFGFNNLAIYTAGGSLTSNNYRWDPARNDTASGGSGTWDAGSTSNMFNGSADVTWNNATLGDQVTFSGSAGTVAVSGAGIVASTLNFTVPNYVLTGGPITMLGNQTINATNGGVTVNNTINGSNGLTISGSGIVVLAGANNFSNGLYVSGGSASFSIDANLGAAGQPIILNKGTVNYTNTNSPTLNRPIRFDAGGGTINLINSAGAGKLILSGANVLTGTGDISKTGPGWLTLYGSNNLTGNWNISAGVVEAGAATVLGTGAVAINNGGELSNNATAAISNPLVLNTGSTIGADFTASGVGTYSGPVLVNGNSNIRLGNFWNGVGQSVTLSGKITGAGSMTTVFASGTSSSTGTLSLSGDNSGYFGNFYITGGTLAPAVSALNVLGTGVITLSGGNLLLQGQVASKLQTQSYNNDVSVSANSSVIIAGSLNAYFRNLSFGTAVLTVSSSDMTSAPYSLNALSTTSGGSPTFNVLPSAGGGLGTLNLFDGLGYPQGLNIASTNSGTPVPHLFQSFSISGGTVALPSHGSGQAQAVLVTSSISLTGSGTLDLANNDLVIKAGNLSSITSMLQRGYEPSRGGDWQGTGIVTSSAAAGPSHLRTLGVIQNNGAFSLFDGQSVSALDVLVKYTYYGDADLSGRVDGSDYTRIDNGFLSSGMFTGWQNGDFNYDGVIDGSDYSLIDNAFNTQGAQISAQASPTAVITSEIANAPIPEPACLSGMLLVAALARRTSKRRF